MPGRHRKPTTPILPYATGALGVTAVLLSTASTAPVAPSAPAAASFGQGFDPVRPRLGHTADSRGSVPTEWWRTDVPRRPVVRPEPVAAAPARSATGASAAVSQPTSTPLARRTPQKAPAARKAAVTSTPTAAAVSASSGVSCRAPWLSGVTRTAQVVGCDVANRFGVTDIGGYRAGSREHGSGKALDLMVGSNRAKGDAIAAYLMANWDALGIKHVIWQQRINYGSGWKGMASRGSATADHRDHIHLLLK